MGYRDVTAAVEGGYSFDSENQILKLEQLRVQADSLGSAELSLHLNNINPRNMKGIPKNIVIFLAMISGVKIAGAEFKYEDDSLVRKLFSLGASRSNQSVDSFIKDMIDQVDKLLLENKHPKAQMLLNNIRDFIVSPEKIHILIKPQKPVPVVKFYFLDNPAQAIEMLGLSVEI
jgi:hypothetical protein